MHRKKGIHPNMEDAKFFFDNTAGTIYEKSWQDKTFFRPSEIESAVFTAANRPETGGLPPKKTAAAGIIPLFSSTKGRPAGKGKPLFRPTRPLKPGTVRTPSFPDRFFRHASTPSANPCPDAEDGTYRRLPEHRADALQSACSAMCWPARQ